MTGRTCKICGGTGRVNMGPVNYGGPSVTEDCYGAECGSVKKREPEEPRLTSDQLLNAALEKAGWD